MKTLITLLLLAGTLHAQYVECTVERIVDGDTFITKIDGEKVRIRINGIDCPELEQPYGDSATIALEKLMPVGSKCEVMVLRPGKYGRPISSVYVGSKSVGLFLIEHGYAWEYYGVASERKGPLSELEASARKARRGLWASDNPIPPWEWRKSH